jgi:hypothetical protein
LLSETALGFTTNTNVNYVRMSAALCCGRERAAGKRTAGNEYCTNYSQVYRRWGAVVNVAYTGCVGGFGVFCVWLAIRKQIQGALEN